MNEKMVEEMAKDTGGCDYPQRDCSKCWRLEKRECSAYAYAKTYYEKGYRKGKIPEGSVVLSKEEWAEYVELRNSEVGELVKENRELGKQCLDWMKLYHKQLTKTNEARKETATEILDEVSKHYGGAWLVKLYKQYGVEV